MEYFPLGLSDEEDHAVDNAHWRPEQAT